MKKFRINSKSIKKALIRVAVTIMILAQSVCLFSVTAVASSDGGSSQSSISYSKKTLHHWKRIYRQQDLEPYYSESFATTRVMIMWGNGINHAYCLQGKSFKGVDMIGDGYIDYLSDGFYTTDYRNCWLMHVCGWTEENRMWAVGFFCRDENNKLWCLNTNGESFYWNENKYRVFNVSAHTESGDPNHTGYNKKTARGYCMIMDQIDDHSDLEWENGSGSLVADYDSSWDYDQWVIYVNDYDSTDYSIHNYTVTSGSSLQIDGDVYLDDNYTLTVEPGATLSIKGNFINNGTIKNYGTVIVYGGAHITYFDPANKYGGSIYNYGSDYGITLKNTQKKKKGEGNFIVMKDACVFLPATDVGTSGSKQYGAVFSLLGGANSVIFGNMVVPGTITMDNSQLCIESSGCIYSCYRITKKLGSLGNVKASDITSLGLTSAASSYKNNFCGTKSVVEMYGKWLNYDWRTNYGKLELISQF